MPQYCNNYPEKGRSRCSQSLPSYCENRLADYQKKIFDNLGVSGAGDITKIPAGFPLSSVFTQNLPLNTPYDKAVRAYVQSNKEEFIFDGVSVGEALLIYLVVEDSANINCPGT